MNKKWFFSLLLGFTTVLATEAATLTGNFSAVASGANVDLTVSGKLDWVHWGLYTESSRQRKATVPPQIGPLKAIGANGGFVTIYQYADHANGYTWHDGYAKTAVTNTTTGVWAYGFPALGSGFQFEVPADLTPRTVQVFVGAYKGRGTLKATLSDSSAPAYNNNSLFNASTGPGGVYTLTYAAGAPGQTLRIEWTLSGLGIGNPSDANVTLQAATLTATDANNPPFGTITDPLLGSAFPESAAVQIKARAQDFDGAVTNVAFYVGTNKLGQVSSPPYELVWNPSARGLYELTAATTDNRGVTTHSRAVELIVHGTNGAQASAAAPAPPTADLTADGLSDWTHWGLVTNTSFNHKALVPRHLSSFTQLGTNPVVRYANNPTAFTWTDGTPTPAINGTSSGIYLTGIEDGFRITAPASLETRQLQVYVGGYGAQATFQAYLSDGSAPPYWDTTIDNVYGSSSVVYTLNYRAAAAGQQLHVVYRCRDLFDQAYGNISLQAATLQGGAADPLPVLLINPTRIGNDFILSFNTGAARTYTVQYCDLLPALAWTNLAVVPGNGALVTVTNFNTTAHQRYYRVQTE